MNLSAWFDCLKLNLLDCLFSGIRRPLSKDLLCALRNSVVLAIDVINEDLQRLMAWCRDTVASLAYCRRTRKDTFTA